MKRILTSTLLAMLFCFGVSAQDMIITGVFDGPLSGGTPKAVEFYVINNISDLSIYGFGSENSAAGGGTIEFTFPAQAATAGTFLYLSTNMPDFNTYFGFNPDFTNSSAGINGDDAVELFLNGTVIDAFGDVNADGTGTSWEYLDGWAYRNDMGTASATFTLADWTYSGIDANDGETSNATAAIPFPIGTYSNGSSTVVHNIAVGGGANSFSPSSLTINQGDSVVWTNAGGFHNVNGTTTTYPANPVGFTNGAADGAAWVFGFKFDVAGSYTYQCDPHAGGGMVGTITVNPAVTPDPEVQFASTSMTVDENAGTVNIMLSITDANVNATAVDVSVDMSSTATSGMDYTFTSPTTVTFAAGSSANEMISIPIIDDMMTEGAETIVLTLSNATNNATVGTNAMYTLNINASDAVTPDIVINEIMYNSPSTDVEFIELYNNEGTAVDLTGWSFAQGIVHTFGSIIMQPGDYLVITEDSIAFHNDYGFAAAEWTSGNLVNSSETIELVDGNGATVDMVTYDDGYPWTEMADGAGNSLALCDVNADNSMVSNWLPEINDAGFVVNFSTIFASPGAANSATCPTNPYFDIEWLTTEDSTGVADSVGTMAQIQGFVYGVNLRGSGLDFTMIDRYGSGISVFNFTPVSNYTVTEGDYVVINGAVSQFRGLTQFSPDSIMLVSGGHPLRLPSVRDSLGEFTESQLITIENVTLVDATQWNNSGSGFNVDITNGTDTFLMRIDNDVDLYSMMAPTGTFDVTGLGRQYSSASSAPFTDGYQIFPRYVADISPYNPTVVIPSFPVYDIATVSSVAADGVADSLGVQCAITGIVHGVNMQATNGDLGFTIIDATGGIGVYSTNDFGGYMVTEGDEVTLKGTISQFNGLTQINPDSLTVNSSGNALVTPMTVTALDESTESELVTITNLTIVDSTAWDLSGSSFNVDFTDGTNTYSIRISLDVDIAGTKPFEFTDVIKITGIGGQFDSSNPFDEGYQMFPRYAADIEILTNTNNILAESIRMYPNPMNEVFVIETTENIETVRITNALGQVVKTLNNVNGTTQVDVTNLAQGMYFVTFTSEENSFTQQIVKQ
ncbi:MAG: lamin tail domain-containing protein [Saprospiraceae bacterium]